MKRTKLMLGVVALSAALLGTGYAAMTDVLTLDGTASTASFDVDYTEGQLKVKDVVVSEATRAEIEDKYDITDIKLEEKLDQDRVSLTVGPLRPGVPVTYTTKMENKSNIDAQLKNIVISQEDLDATKWIQAKIVLKMQKEKKLLLKVI